MTRVLLTGASGRMASAIRPLLREIFDEVVLFARSPIDDPGANERSIAGDLADRGAVAEAAKGVDVVVHLGGKADEAPFDEIAQANIAGTYNVFEESRSAGVRRVVYASSHHVTGFHSVETMVDERSPVRPDTMYGVSKVFGEAVGRLYADKWGLEVVCLRIGVCRERPENSDQLRTWLSIPDSVSLVKVAISADLPERFWVVYGVSNNSRRFWGDGSARSLGYFPRDRADDFREAFDAKAPFSSNYQGGRFTGAEYAGGTW